MTSHWRKSLTQLLHSICSTGPLKRRKKWIPAVLLRKYNLCQCFQKGPINRLLCFRPFQCGIISFCELSQLSPPFSSKVHQHIVHGCLFQNKDRYCSTRGELQGHGWTSHETPGPSLSIYHVHSVISAGLRKVIFQQANTSIQHNATQQTVGQNCSTRPLHLLWCTINFKSFEKPFSGGCTYGVNFYGLLLAFDVTRCHVFTTKAKKLYCVQPLF